MPRMSSSWMQWPPLCMQAKQPEQYSTCRSMAWMIFTSWVPAASMPSKKARVMHIVSLFSLLGLPLNTSIFMMVFSCHRSFCSYGLFHDPISIRFPSGSAM